MGRIACLHIPDLPLAAALREDPELRGKPLAIVEAQPRDRTQSPTIAAGWMRGTTVTQARAVEPDLELRVLSLEGIRSAQEALLDVASSVSPRVEGKPATERAVAVEQHPEIAADHGRRVGEGGRDAPEAAPREYRIRMQEQDDVAASRRRDQD